MSTYSGEKKINYDGSSDVVKPKIIALIISNILSAIVTIALCVALIWIALTMAPVLGLLLFCLFVLACYMGGTEIIGDLGGVIFGAWIANAIALRLTHGQVSSSRLLKCFFYIDRSRPLTGSSSGRGEPCQDD